MVDIRRSRIWTLAAALVGVGVAHAYEDSKLQMEAAYTWDSNINRAKPGADVRHDSIYSLNFNKSRTFSLSENTRFIATATLGGDRFQYYAGLSQVNAGIEGLYQYRASSDFDTATWGLFARVSATNYQTTLRDGYQTALGASVSQAITDRINAFAAITVNNRRADSAVFSTKDASVRTNIDYALRGGNTLYFTGEYRDGDLVTTAQSTLESVTIAKVMVADDAYPGTNFFSYKFDGTTTLATIGYNVGLGSHGSIDLSWRRVEATPRLRPVWATSYPSYVTNQFGLSYLKRF